LPNIEMLPRIEKAAAGQKPTAAIQNVGGVDGTRTRDPRRDRPVF
jgi:hypothetical protein